MPFVSGNWFKPSCWKSSEWIVQHNFAMFHLKWVPSMNTEGYLEGQPANHFVTKVERFANSINLTKSSRVRVQVVFITLYLKHFRPVACPEPVKLQIVCVGFKEYEKHCYDLSQLRLTCKYGKWAGAAVAFEGFAAYKSIPLLTPVGFSFVHRRCLVRK